MSSVGRQPTIAPEVGLGEIPEELQAKVLHELSSDDLLTCVKVCQLWKKIVASTSSLQYRIGLAFTGMKDGPPGQSSPLERTAIMRKYQATWGPDSVSHRALSRLPNASMAKFIGDTFVYVMNDSQRDSPVFYLRQLASFFTGVTEKTWKVDVSNLFKYDQVIASYAVDVAQDLVVVTTLEEDDFPECYLLSLSGGGAPHPLAKRPRLTGNSNICIPPDTRSDEVAVVGDLLEWTVFGQDTQMHVFNWKTGELTWDDGFWEEDEDGEIVQFADTRCRIVDAAHVLEISKSDIFVHNSARRSHPSDHETVSSRLCQLQLPRLAEGYSAGDIDCYVQRPPSSHCPPHFECDPDLTVLVMTYQVSGPHGSVTHAVIFVPLSTIRKVADSCQGSGSGSTPNSPSPPPKSVPWDKWVEHGARLILVLHDSGEFEVSTMGSRVALTFKCHTQQPQPHCDLEVFLFEAHARARAVRDGDASEVPEMKQRMTVSDCFTTIDAPIFGEQVRSTLPYRVTRTVVRSAFKHGTVHVLQDGIVVAE